MQFPWRRNNIDTHKDLFTTILVSVVFGVSSGIVGMLLVTAYVIPELTTTNSETSTVVGSRSVLVSGVPVVTPPVVASASRSQVLIFKKANRLGASYLRTFLPVDAIGSGMVLTSDGWLVSHGEVFTDSVVASLSSYVAVIGTDVFTIEQVVRDSFTGAVFLKVDGTNLAVTSFGTDAEFEAGQSMYAYDVHGRANRVEVIAYDNVIAHAPRDVVFSSEQQQKVLHLSMVAEGVVSGSMLVNTKGDVVGIFTRGNGSENHAIVFSSFSNQIGPILREQSASRPYLGLHYIDVSHLVGASEYGERAHGVLVTSAVDGRPAVYRSSPAQLAGIRQGDIILAVNEEGITANKALSDLLAEYEPGSVVTLLVRHGVGNVVDIPIEVTLGEAL